MLNDDFLLFLIRSMKRILFQNVGFCRSPAQGRWADCVAPPSGEIPEANDHMSLRVGESSPLQEHRELFPSRGECGDPRSTPATTYVAEEKETNKSLFFSFSMHILSVGICRV